MTASRKSLWYLSRDSLLLDRLRPLVASAFDLHAYDHAADFMRAQNHQTLNLCLIDVRLGDEGPDPGELVDELKGHVLILLGPQGSPHLRGLESRNYYALLDVNVEPAKLLHTLHQGQEHLELREENLRLRSRLTLPHAPSRQEDPRTPPSLFTPQDCIRFFRQTATFDQLAETLTHHLCTQMKLSRAGLYLREREEQTYTLKSGHMLLPGIRQEAYPAEAPLVRWLERHAHLVSRTDLSSLVSPEDERMLGKALDQWGAELLIPLRAQNGLMGWVFTGRPFSGHPFLPSDTAALIEVVDLTAAALESARLLRDTKASFQHTHSVLQELHIGILQASPAGQVLWASPAAQEHLDLQKGPLPDQLSPDMIRLIQEAAKDDTGTPARFAWRDVPTGRDFSLQARRIHPSAPDSPVMVTIEDRSQETRLHSEKQDREAQLFWEQMSDGLSHEVRNPLVTLKTFTQLLPEKIDDPAFRTVFQQQVEKEIGKLQNLVEQVQSFARPEGLNYRSLDVRSLLESTVSDFRKEMADVTGAPDLQMSIQPELPELEGDPEQLRTALHYLLQNAWEAVQGSQGHITLGAEYAAPHILVKVRDDGAGCPPEKLDTLFSPFTTSKAQGLGLGLPIARRIARDHGGDLSLLSTPRGTHVSLTLPTSHTYHETPADR